MEKSFNSREEGKFSFRAPGRTQHDLRRAFLENQELAAENAALRRQIASQEFSWQQEKRKLLDERDSLLSTLLTVRNSMETRVTFLESERARQKQADSECKQMEKKKEKAEIRSLKKSLRRQEMETEKVKNSWKEERDQVNEMKLSFDKTVQHFKAEWESRSTVRKEEAATEPNTLQQDCETSQVIPEQEEGMIAVMKQMIALVEDNLATLVALDTEVRQSETEWQTKHCALEDRLKSELEAKEESAQKILELQKKNREMEETWLSEENEWLTKEQEWCAKEHEWFTKEEEWLSKAGRMEEEMKLLSQQNVELEELASKTDREKARMRKEEKKAKKEAEKRLEKERKKEEERVKKENKENEKKEKERLKREKKQRKE